MSIDSHKEKLKSKLRRKKASDAYANSGVDDSASIFSQIVPEDFVFTGRDEQNNKHNFLSSEHILAIQKDTWENDIPEELLLHVIVETTELFATIGYMADLPYIIAHIQFQKSLGVSNPKEIAETILLSCSLERPSSGIDPFEWLSDVGISIFDVLTILPVFHKYVRIAMANENSEDEARDGLDYASEFIHHAGMNGLNREISLTVGGTIGNQMVFFPEPALRVGARILEGGSRMLANGFWTIGKDYDEESPELLAFWTHAFQKEAGILRKAIVEGHRE